MKIFLSISKKTEHITPYSLEINRILISPDPEELWLGAHFMNDRNFNTVTVGIKRGSPVSNNAYFEGILVRAKRQIREGDDITVDYNQK